MNKQFSISALFRWTTLSCLAFGVLQRIYREPLDYDYVSSFLLPFYDILWLMNSEDVLVRVSLEGDLNVGNTLMFGLGCICSIVLHSMVLIITYCLVFGLHKQEKEND